MIKTVARGFALFLTVAIVGLLCTSTPAQDNATLDRLIAARDHYYTPTAGGLKSFSCDATINWKELMARSAESEVAEDNPVLKYLQGVRLSVNDEFGGQGSLGWADTAAPPAGKEDDLKDLRLGFQSMMQTFFQMWNSFMDGSTIPVPDKDVTATATESGIHLHGTSPDATMDEDFDNNLLLTSVSVVTPELKIVSTPTYVKTADGLIVSGVEYKLNQSPDPEIHLSFRIEYAKAGSYQLPSHVVAVEKISGVAIDINFDACQANGL